MFNPESTNPELSQVPSQQLEIIQESVLSLVKAYGRPFYFCFSQSEAHLEGDFYADRFLEQNYDRIELYAHDQEQLDYEMKADEVPINSDIQVHRAGQTAYCYTIDARGNGTRIGIYIFDEGPALQYGIFGEVNTSWLDEEEDGVFSPGLDTRDAFYHSSHRLLTNGEILSRQTGSMISEEYNHIGSTALDLLADLLKDAKPLPEIEP